MAHHSENVENDANNNSSLNNSSSKASRWLQNTNQDVRQIPRFIFDPDSSLVFYWTAAVGLATLYNAWTIALRIAFPEVRQERGVYYLYYIDLLSDFIYLADIFLQLRTAYLEDGIPVFEPSLIRKYYTSQTYFVQDIISVIPSQSVLSLLPDAVGCCKYFLCTAGAARLTKLLKFHILYRFYDLAESFTSNPHLIRVLRLFLNLAIIIHWIACLYYLLSEYEGLGSNQWVYTNSTDEQRFSRKYIVCLYWSAMTLTTIGNTNSPETDVEYIFTGIIFMTGVFVFATVMGNVGDVISSMNANRQEFQARMDHIQMYLTHKKVPASLQLKIKKWAEYTWSRTKATDESRLLNMLPERLRAEVAVHVHLDSLKKVKIFEQCETGFLCELVLKLRSQVFSPGDYVCRVGETGREMFIINHGKVEVLVPSPASNKDMVVAVLSEGNYFGEISLLRLDGAQNRRTADVRSIGYSELLCLSRRDLMAALVEYPEAKSILELQAKKRMKTNLQAQRTFSVDKLLRSSQDYSSTDSGIASRDERGHEVSEIKAMIQELKNANKVPGKTVWQMIARCEVLQAKLGEKEKEVEESKQRVRELEQLLCSRHSIRHGSLPSEENLPDAPSRCSKTLRPNHKVTKQYSQDEGRPVVKELTPRHQVESAPVKDRRTIPDLRVTRASETSEDEGDAEMSRGAGEVNIKTSKITSVQPARSDGSSNAFKRSDSCDGLPQSAKSAGNLKEAEDSTSGKYSRSVRSSWHSDGGGFSSETTVDHEVFLDDFEQVSFKSSFQNEFCVSDSFRYPVQTIPEESEDVLDEPYSPPAGSRAIQRSFTVIDRNTNERFLPPDPVMSTYTDLDPLPDTNLNTQSNQPSPNSIYRDLSQSDVEVKHVPRGQCSTTRRRFGGGSVERIVDDLYDSEGDVDFAKLGSDESTSRRNSWSLDSENDADSDDDDASS